MGSARVLEGMLARLVERLRAAASSNIVTIETML